MVDWDDQIWDSVDNAVLQLLDSYRKGMPTEVSDIVPPVDDPSRILALTTLLQVDIEHRWKSGEQALVERLSR